MTVFDYLFSSDSDRKPLTQNEVQALADDASSVVVEWAKEDTYVGELQAIRQYRRDTGASLEIALRVIKELKWRAHISKN
ncbi:MAG: hypothetical protein KTR29_04485 [Rhodothermaceae bacterium]|nr:hypothetical protein [Rhodothermaceae bacterium]